MTVEDVEANAMTSADQSQPTEEEIRSMVAHAAHWLPAQGPIEVFVHHNTLHVFEESTFHDAVKSGMARYAANPYFPEQKYRELFDDGRITVEDLKFVIDRELRNCDRDCASGLNDRGEIRLAMLRHPLQIGPDAELRWVVAETDALERFHPEISFDSRNRIVEGAREWMKKHANDDKPTRFDDLLTRFGRTSDGWSDATWESFALQLTWRICRSGMESFPSPLQPETFVRPRDIVLRATGEDTDRNVHDVLIRFCGAFVDQGYSDWNLPHRDEGFFAAFLDMFSRPTWCGEPWLNGLAKELQQLQQSGVSAEQSVVDSMERLGIDPAERGEFISQTLLSLRGWAGMIWQLESGVDWVVHTAPTGSLVGFLAAHLILERQAIAHAAKEAGCKQANLRDTLQTLAAKIQHPSPLSVERRAFLLYQVAQMLGWPARQLLALSETDWRELTDELEGFGSLARRRVYHEAYERQYYNQALDAFAHQTARVRTTPQKTPPTRPSFQIVTCIDDREESFRRHLEEVHPDCETFGAAGFFAVAIYYRGAADGFYKPLCPGVITPDHYVQEDVGYTFEGAHRSRAELRKRLGLASHLFQTQSRTFIGGILAGITGSLATAPLVARVLFPHLTARIRKRFGSLIQPPPITKLQLERYADEPGPANGAIGFNVSEMAGIVVRLLQDMGVTEPAKFARLFIICGHGSSSLNNPHESAYCCGACAGKRGGPNARAFAEMANDWRVRAKAAEQGITIPEDTVFVGAYHNTCDDSVVYYDLDRLPASHRADFETAHSAIDEGRRRNAHERCRRFVSAPLSLTSAEALRHVEGRSQDISQARPEYNHATNALCIVGRREWTRGLFLDRRAFLTSYDPTQDDEESSILARILAAAIPVCAGINLEYYFSCVDPHVYGSGSKLPHNIVSLLGVMEGTSSDLRTGLYEQMVEIHEPLRLLCVIETTAEAMLGIIDRNPAIGRLVRGEWVYLAVINSDTSQIELFRDGRFEPYEPTATELKVRSSSQECYQGSRDHAPFFSIAKSKASNDN